MIVLKLLAVAVGALCFLPGCELLGEPDSSGSTVGAAELEARDPVVERRAEIYAAVIRELATHGRLSRRFEVIYVLDGPIKGAGHPRASLKRDQPGEPFGTELKNELLERLDGLPPVTFVPRRSSVLTEEGAVRNHGVLVTVGPIVRDRQRARLGGNQWVAGKGAAWFKFALRQRASGWAVTRASNWAVS